MDMRIPPLSVKTRIESNPLQSRLLVRRLAVLPGTQDAALAMWLQSTTTTTTTAATTTTNDNNFKHSTNNNKGTRQRA